MQVMRGPRNRALSCRCPWSCAGTVHTSYIYTKHPIPCICFATRSKRLWTNWTMNAGHDIDRLDLHVPGN